MQGVIKVEKGAFSPEEAARYLGVHPQTIYKLLRTGELPGKKVGQLWRIPKEGLVRYLEGAEIARETAHTSQYGPREEKAAGDAEIGQPVTPKLWKLAGMFTGGPEDLAENHDKYIAQALEEEGRH